MFPLVQFEKIDVLQNQLRFKGGGCRRWKEWEGEDQNEGNWEHKPHFDWFLIFFFLFALFIFYIFLPSLFLMLSFVFLIPEAKIQLYLIKKGKEQKSNEIKKTKQKKRMKERKRIENVERWQRIIPPSPSFQHSSHSAQSHSSDVHSIPLTHSSPLF